MRSSVQGTCLANDSPLRPEGRFGRLSFAAWSLLGSLFFLIACSTIGFGLIQMSEKQSSYSNQNHPVYDLFYRHADCDFCLLSFYFYDSPLT